MTRLLGLLFALIFFVCLIPSYAIASETPNLGPLLKKAIASPGKSFRFDSGKAEAVDEKARLQINKNLGKLPLRFEKNEGQTDEQVKFLSRGQGYQFFLTPTESVMVLTKAEGKHPRERFGIQHAKFEEPENVEHAVVRMQVVGGNPDPVIRGENKLSGTSNYFVGNDQSKWRQGVENYSRVHYEDVYPGIDLVYYGNQRKLEYDFIVKPGADPKKIELSFEGADKTSIDSEGNLVLKTQVGDVIQHAPVIYQTIQGKKQSIDGRYILNDNHSVTFHVADYDPEHPLIIDPVLGFSTYFEGEISDVATDNNGNIFVTGKSRSPSFPLVNPFPGYTEGLFLTKIVDNYNNPYIEFSTFIGSSGIISGIRINANISGDVVITGKVFDSNFPLVNEIQGQYMGNGDVFAVKIENTFTGPSLVFSTYIGGSEHESGYGIDIDAQGNVYVAGETFSEDFPLLNSISGFSGISDTFLVKIIKVGAGYSLGYSTLFGGNNFDTGIALAVSNTGEAYITGYTASPDFPLVNEIEGPQGDWDVFVSKIVEQSGNPVFDYSTIVGGPSVDWAHDIEIDNEGNAYVTGEGYDGFHLINPLPEFPSFSDSSMDCFVFKLEDNPGGPVLNFSIAIGTPTNGIPHFREQCWSIGLDDFNNIFITGYTSSNYFLTRNSVFEGSIVDDVIVLKINQINGSPKLAFSTQVGGGGATEMGRGIAGDHLGNVYFVGKGGYSFPQKNPLPGMTTPGHFITKIESKLDVNDFDDEGDSDLLMVDEDGNIFGGIMENSVPQSFGFLLTADPAAGWTVNATGDTNGDNKADLLLYNTTTGEYRVVTLDSTTVLTDTVALVIDPVIGVEPRGTGDFDGDGQDEIVIFQPATGAVGLVYLNGGVFDHLDVVTTVDAANDWTLLDAADFTADGKTDFLIQNTVTGETSVIEMDSSTAGATTSIFTLAPATGLTIEDTADFNGDGKTDILTVHTSGALAVLEMDGTTFQSLYVPGGLLPNWQLVNAGNYDGINKADFLFHDPTTGEVITGIQNGATITSYNTVLNLGSASGWLFH